MPRGGAVWSEKVGSRFSRFGPNEVGQDQVQVGTRTRSGEIFAPRCVSGSVAHLLPLSRCCRVTLPRLLTDGRREPFFAPRACLARTAF